MPRLTVCLVFESGAEEAAAFYASVFEDARPGRVARFGEHGPGPAGGVMSIELALGDQPVVLVNGGPHFRFTEAISLSVDCATQEEIDAYSEKLSAGGGEVGPCGWVRDRFGVSWQVQPAVLAELLADPDPAKAGRVLQAMLGMRKIDLAALRRAYAGDA